MDVVIVTPIRLLGESLGACLHGRDGIVLAGVVYDLAELRGSLALAHADAALIDITLGFDAYKVIQLARDFPRLKLIAVGLREQCDEIVRCGRAGFTGYVARDATLDALRLAISDAASGRLCCPATIVNGIFRALCDNKPAAGSEAPHRSLDFTALTQREVEVARLIGRGLANKEIASELNLSVATIKHHVHNLLNKLRLQRRSQLLRGILDRPAWLIHVAASDQTNPHPADQSTRIR